MCPPHLNRSRRTDSQSTGACSVDANRPANDPTLIVGQAQGKMTEKYEHLCPDATGREAMDVLDRMAAAML